MEEEISAISTNTRIDKIKNFIIQNRTKIILLFCILLVLLFAYFFIGEQNKKKKIKISNKYNSIVLLNLNDNKSNITNGLVEIIYDKDKTYSPLALYYIIDNKLILDKEKINELFDTVLAIKKLDFEIKNLIIYKKALYNADTADEIKLLNILDPILKSESVWKSHSLYLIAEYFFEKKEFQKSKEFFNQIINLKNANSDILLQTQKRLKRDLSD